MLFLSVTKARDCLLFKVLLKFWPRGQEVMTVYLGWK